jgi:tetratricopeptide (TPR) repeat protein
MMRLILRSILPALLMQTATVAADYAPPGACAGCHTQIAQAYRRTGMARSLYKPAPANTIEDYRNRREFLHSLSDTHYSMFVRDGAYYQRRWQMGFDGAETNVEEMKIDAVIGSGSHARSYLHRTASGGYIELPLGWYAEKGGYWAMSPGFNTAHPQTRRFVSYQCVFCHDAYPQIPAGHDAPGSDPIFSGDLPGGIDCQRCHGPGAKHVSLAQTAGAKPDDIRASIMNPARLTPALRMDLCMQCHLQPASGAIPSLIRRFDRGPFSFTPGEPLANFLLVFDHAPDARHDYKFEIVNSSAYRLRKSACFLKSNGAMTCTTCHDPHGARPTNYSAVCKQCHGAVVDAAVSAGRHPAATECVTCHMQKRRTEDVVHAVMTDHWVQRRLPPGNPLAELSERQGAAAEYRGGVVPYYPLPLPPTGENALYLAVAQGAPQRLAAELARVRPIDAEFYMALGDAWQKIGELPNAVAAYQQALRLRPDFPRALLFLAVALKASGELAKADNALNRAIKLDPASAVAWFQSGAIDFDSGRTASAIEKTEKAIALDPDSSGAHAQLAALLWRTGDAERAENELRTALRIDPYDASAYDLIGRVLASPRRGASEASEALFDFEKATRLRPGYAPHLYDYALELSTVNRSSEARASVEAALRADPDMAEAHALLGGLLASNQQPAEAAKEYEGAIRLKPDFARAHLDLARVLAGQGDIQAAVDHLRKAAAGSDPTVAQLAAQALQRIGK